MLEASETAHRLCCCSAGTEPHPILSYGTLPLSSCFLTEVAHKRSRAPLLYVTGAVKLRRGETARVFDEVRNMGDLYRWYLAYLRQMANKADNEVDQADPTVQVGRCWAAIHTALKECCSPRHYCWAHIVCLQSLARASERHALLDVNSQSHFPLDLQRLRPKLAEYIQLCEAGLAKVCAAKVTPLLARRCRRQCTKLLIAGATSRELVVSNQFRIQTCFTHCNTHRRVLQPPSPTASVSPAWCCSCLLAPSSTVHGAWAAHSQVILAVGCLPVAAATLHTYVCCSQD